MEFIFKIILLIIINASIEGMKSKTIPIWIRIICTIIVSLVFLAVIVLIGMIAIFMWKENQLLLSIPFLIVDTIVIIGAIKMIKKLELKKSEKK